MRYLLACCWLLAGSSLLAADANRLTYLDEFCDPYYPHRAFAKLTTPQWVGDAETQCVVVLAIDDMRDPEKYETYLRPILTRLQQIDGRAPVSIMTNQVDPKNERLQQWLKEGVALDVHTFDHPCPCLQGGDFPKAKGTYEKCVDLLSAVPNNKPVAFRMPCCDSLNTPSPRFWREIFNKTTVEGNYLSIDSSVFNIITGKDTTLPKELTHNEQGEERFRRYVPFPSFVNTIEDYPYPYVIGQMCWQFPCVVPSDWSAQHVQKPNNPDTVRDLKLALDACVIKQGVYNLVFHPHGWIRNDQVVELIEHAVAKHGSKVKFLNFQECNERLNKHLLAGQPLRNANGQDNGVRLLDANGDGYLDVIIGQQQRQNAPGQLETRAGQTRIWDPRERRWLVGEFPESFDASGPRFGVLLPDGRASMLGRGGEVFHLTGASWTAVKSTEPGTVIPTKNDKGPAALDYGVRLRDVDGDGCCECLTSEGAIYAWDRDQNGWVATGSKLPAGVSIRYTDEPDIAASIAKGQHDGGARFVDLDGDRDADLVVANDKRQGVWRFDTLKTGWQPVKLPEGLKIPLIAREGLNNGAWFHSRQLWVQNEHTQRLPDHVERCSFAQLLGDDPKKTATAPLTPTDRSSAPGSEATAANLAQFPTAKTPEQALATFQLPAGLKLELVAAEPLVVDPVAFDWGPDGRLWVVEMRDYPRGLDGAGQPGGRVKVLTDTNGDGQYDDARVFLDRLPFPTGIKVWRKGVIVTAAPEVIYAEDTNGDHQADIKQTLYRGFGEGNQQHRVNGLRWNCDGWLYLGNGDSGGRIRSLATQAEVDIGGRDLRIRPDTGELDAISGQTQFSLCFNEAGDRFGGNNSQPLWHYVLEDHYLRRNPHVAPPATRNNVPRQPGNAPVFPTSKTITRFNDYGTANRFTSACGIEIYRAKLLGDAYHGNSFVCEPVHNLVHRELLEPAGVSFTSRRAAEEQAREFLSSSDNWFRPVMARTGPDGALYIADMYRLVIEHPTWIPVDWQQKLDLRAGSDKGRIYRVVRADQPVASWPKLSTLEPVKLVALLESTNGTLREMVQQQLIWNNDRAAVEPLQLLARSSRQPYARLAALWTLEHFEALSIEQLLAALGDEHPAVRRQAARLCEKRLNKEAKLGPALLALLDDADRQVALQAACSLGEWHHARGGTALGKLLEKRGEDAFVSGAVLSSINDANRGAFLASIAGVPALRQRWIEPLLQSALKAKDYATVAQVVRGLEAPGELTGRLTLLALVLDRLERAPAPNERIFDEAGKKVIATLFAEASRVASDNVATLPERLAAVKLLQEQGTARKIVPDIDVADALRKLVVAGNALELRIAAMQALAENHASADALRPLLAELKLDTSPEAAAAIITAICDTRDVELMTGLLTGWSTRTPAQRTRIFEALLKNTAGTNVVLSGLAAKVITAEQLGSAQQQRLLSYPVDELRARAQELLAHQAGNSRAKIVEQYSAEALHRAADAQRGRVAFEKTCANCHKLNGVGHIVGPDLASLTDRSPQTLLIAMLDPNRAVEDKFREYLVLDHDGKLISGIVTSETGTSLTILAAAGKEHQVLRKDIDTLRASEKSLMPEGLERELTPQVCADIIAYVRASGSPAKKFSGNDPQLVKANAEGVLELHASAARIYGPKLIFEPKYKNLGYWLTEQDQAVWSVEIREAGNYRVTFDYACQASAAGDKFQLRIGEQVVSGVVASTGTWDDYKQQEAATVRLKPGECDVQLRSAGAVREALFDLRQVTLKRVGP